MLPPARSFAVAWGWPARDVSGLDGAKSGGREIGDYGGAPCRVAGASRRLQERIIIVGGNQNAVGRACPDVPARRKAKPDMIRGLVQEGVHILLACADKPAGIGCGAAGRGAGCCEQAGKPGLIAAPDLALKARRLRRGARARGVRVKRERAGRDGAGALCERAGAGQGERRGCAYGGVGETAGGVRAQGRRELEPASGRVVKAGPRRGQMHALPGIGTAGKRAGARFHGVGDHGLCGLVRAVDHEQPRVAGTRLTGGIEVETDRARLVAVCAARPAGYAKCGCGRPERPGGDNGIKKTRRPCRIACHIGLGCERAKIVRNERQPAPCGVRVKIDKRLSQVRHCRPRRRIRGSRR